MRWFGFGFNGFGQIVALDRSDSAAVGAAANEVKILCPIEVSTSEKECRSCRCNKPKEVHQVSASWSTRLSLHLTDGSSGVFLDGFRRLGSKCCGFIEQTSDCKDAIMHESLVAIAFQTRIEMWDLHRESGPVWSMEVKPLDNSAPPLKLPLVPEGYIALKPPFYRHLSPHLKAKSLALGPEHAILLSATGAVYTWGLGSHGQLGHGSLTPEEEPRAVEALWGVPMKAVAAGGWHCCCISESADLYMWGWNESGQLGLPSLAVRKALERNICSKAAQCQDANAQPSVGLKQEEEDKEVFISIQAFPALLDLNPACEIKAASCGSRHTAAVTAEGNLYTWGWGEYGQLGHKNMLISDEPQCVDFFREHQLYVTDVICGAWNTFVTVVKQEEISPL